MSWRLHTPSNRFRFKFLVNVCLTQHNFGFDKAEGFQFAGPNLGKQ